MNFRSPIRVLFACQLKLLQCSSFITLCLGYLGIELCYNGTILQRNYRKMMVIFL